MSGRLSDWFSHKTFTFYNRRDSTNPFFIFFSFKYDINVIIQIKGIISKEILFFVFYTKIRAFYIK